MRYSILWYGIGTLLLLAVVVGSLIPVPRVESAPNDKLIHFLLYFLLMAWFGQLQTRRLWLALGFISLGLLLELIQGQTRYRTFEWLDVLANSAGVAVAWLVVKTPLGRILGRIDHFLQTRRINIQ
jgi:VanZ family protein